MRKNGLLRGDETHKQNDTIKRRTKIEWRDSCLHKWLHTHQSWQPSTISIQQLSRIYHRGWQVVVSKNVDVYSHTNTGVLHTASVIALDSPTSDHLPNTPVSAQ